MEASESLSCENNNISLFSALPESSNMYSNKDSNLISDAAFATRIIRPLHMYNTAIYEH